MEVGPINPRAMRAEILKKTRINDHVAEDKPLLTYIQQSRNLKFVRGYNTPGSPAHGVAVTGVEERDREERTDDVTDGGNDQKLNILNFQRLIFLQYTETFIILAPAGKLRRFRGGFDSMPSYTLCLDTWPRTSLIAQ